MKVPIDYKHDQEAFGLHVHCVLEYCYLKDHSHCVVSLHLQNEERKDEVLDMFKDYDKHYVAEFRLTGLIAQMLGWAGDLEEERGIAGA
eukprot:1500554-Rhodomonas_salina.1